MRPTGETLTVKVLCTIRERDGRKLVRAPDGTVTAPGRPQIDSAMLKALARAFRWRQLLETGVYGTVAELTAAEKVSESYVGRVLRLTLLAPKVREAILAWRQPESVTLVGLMKGAMAKAWRKQSHFFPEECLIYLPFKAVVKSLQEKSSRPRPTSQEQRERRPCERRRRRDGIFATGPKPHCRAYAVSQRRGLAG